MAKTSPTVLRRLRLSANPGIGVIAWPPQHPAVLPTSVLAAMARTRLQSAWPMLPPCPARLRSVLLTHRLQGPAANPVICRLAPPVSFHYSFYSFNYSFLGLLLRDLGLSVAIKQFSCY